MADKPLSAQQLTDLLKPKSAQVKPSKKPTEFQPPPQQGPLRLVDDAAPCLVAGYYQYSDPNDYSTKEWIRTHGKCGTTTYLRVRGVPTCHIHAVRKLNELLIEAGITK